MKRNSYVILVALGVALGGFLFGYDTAIISGAVGYYSTFFDLSAVEQGFSVSSALVGCVIGAFINGAISQKYGRKKALIFGSFCYFVSALFSAIPYNFTIFLLARMLGGIGVGMASALVPMYIAEISPAKIRGALGTLNQMAIAFGMVCAYIANWQIDKMHTLETNITTGWRWMFGSECFPALAFAIIMFIVPETPRWLLMKNRKEEALTVLERVNGSREEALQQSESIMQSLQADTKKTYEKVSLFSKGIFRIFAIDIGLVVINQFCGINVIMYYATEFLKDLNIGGSGGAYFQTILIGVCSFIATFISLFTIDKFGRKPLMVIGTIGTGINMFLVGVSIYTGNVTYMTLVYIFLYIMFFGFTLGPVMWVLLSEIFPNNVRDKAMSVCTGVLWVCNIVVAQTFPMINANETLITMFNGAFPFMLYGAIALLAVPFTIIFVPETKGKTLEALSENAANESKGVCKL